MRALVTPIPCRHRLPNENMDFQDRVGRARTGLGYKVFLDPASRREFEWRMGYSLPRKCEFAVFVGGEDGPIIEFYDCSPGAPTRQEGCITVHTVYIQGCSTAFQEHGEQLQKCADCVKDIIRDA